MPVLTAKDIKIYTSSATDPNDATIVRLGGPRTTEELSDNRLHNIFPKTTKDEETTGVTKFRCFYLFNANTTTYLKNPVLFIVSDTSSSNDSVAIGWGSANVGSGLSGATDNSIEPAIGDQYTFPPNVTFFAGNTRNTGAVLDGDIPPNSGKPFWIMYQSAFGAQDFQFNIFQFEVVSDNLRGLVTKTTEVSVPKIRFDVIGEVSSTSDATTMANYIIASAPDFICTVGDNNTDGNSSFFTSMYNSYLNRMLLAFGPSDVSSLTTANNYKAAINQYKFAPNISNQYYSKTFGNVHILIMDTSFDIAYDNPSDQYTFVLKDLKSAYSDPSIDWIMVMTNAAMYSSPSNTSGQLTQDDLRDTYHELFVQYGVCVVFQGTFKTYERFKVLGYNITNPAEPTTFAYDGPNNYTITDRKSFDDGCIFVTIGSGGSGYDAFTSQASNSFFLDNIDYGYVNVIADNTSRNKTITFRYYSTSRGTQFFIDSFSITRVKQ